MRLVWLASFPKSGNTWARFLIYQYLHGEATSSAQVALEIPDMHAPGEYRASAAVPGRTRLIAKTHLPCTPSLRGHGFIYIVRHPRDIVLSELNMVRLVSKNDPRNVRPDAEWIRMFIEGDLNPEFLKRPDYGPFEANWKSWLDQTRIPGIFVRYEDLKADPLRELRRMVESLGDTFDEERGRRAVELSTFDRMRALEVREKVAGKMGTIFVGAEKKHREGVFFMNKGQSGRSLDKIAPGLDALCDARFRATLDNFGYGGAARAGA